MKIYILIPWFQPAYKAGGPIQSVANMVNQMQPSTGSGGSDSMEFKIFCGNRDLDGSILQGVAFDAWVPYNAHTKVWYSSSGHILPVLQQQIKNEKPDYLFITGMYDWQFNTKPLLFCKGVKKIISVRGMLHPGALSQKGFKKKIYLGLWKLLGLHQASVFHATDEAEKQYIQQVFGRSVNVHIAANFPNVLDQQPVVQKEPGKLKLVSVALISAMKNILLVLEGLEGDWSRESGNMSRESGDGSRESLRSDILGQAQSDIPLIEYNIYGPVKDAAYWEACEAQIKKLPANITVNYHGDIAPAKIADALAASHVFILPSKSENFGHAIYEALSAGRPVITSNNTPWNKLEAAKAGMNVSVTKPDELVKAIRFFAAFNQEQLTAWSSHARAYAEQAVDINVIRQQYAALFS